MKKPQSQERWIEVYFILGGYLMRKHEMIQPAKRFNIESLKLVKESSFHYQQRHISSPKDSYEVISQFLENADREHVVVLCLDTKNQPTNISVCHIGSLNASIVHPREVMKTAVLSNAASIIIAHNHPSGICDPSKEDIAITKRLVDVGDIMSIPLLDHLIIGDGTYISLKEKGYI